MKLDLEYIELILIVEMALRKTILVWNDEEYRVMAETIAEKIAERIENANL